MGSPPSLCLLTQQESCNFSLCKTRTIIERVNGKRRFHCLHSELRVDLGRACKISLACVMLFKLSKDCEEEEDEQHESIKEVEEDGEEGVLHCARDRSKKF